MKYMNLNGCDQKYPHIPLEMFLYFPRDKEEYFMGEGLEIRRYLFDGSAINQLTPFEQDKFDSFLNTFERKKHKVPAELINNPFWTPSWKFRWLYSEKYDYANTISAMVEHNAYLQTNPSESSARIDSLLRQGVFYVSGRDAYYRPILIFNIEKMLKLNLDIDEILEAQRVFFETVLYKLLLPGQVESWIALIDVGDQNLLSMLSPLKKSFGFLMNTFRCRMMYCYVVRPSDSMLFLWKMAKSFLHPDTIKKINILDSETVGPLLEFTNPSQIEQKYGGSRSDMEQHEFWPIKQVDEAPNPDCTVDGICPPLLSIQEYRDMYQNGQLDGHYISDALIKLSEKNTDNSVTNSNHDNEPQDSRQEMDGLAYQRALCEFVWPTEDQIPCIEEILLPTVISWNQISELDEE